MGLSQTLSALAEPNRQKIVTLLKRGERSVTELMQGLSITMPTLSHHLDILKRAGLVSSRREGQSVLYQLNMSVVEEVTQEVVAFLRLRNKH